MNNVINTNSNEEFVQTICEIVKEQATKNIEKKGSFTFVLSGGRTPKNVFTKLIKDYKNSMDWSKVHFFWLDERYVDSQNKDSNYKLAYENLISKLDSVGSVHRIKCELKLQDTIVEYTKDILNFFGTEEVRFDFMLLGMGEDGHIASLFPKSREIHLTDQLVLNTEKKYSEFYRISLGLDLINNSKYKLLMIQGKEKMTMLKQKSLNLPIHQIKEIQKVIYNES